VTLPAETPLSKLRAFFRKSEPEVYPIRLEFELSNKCNLECAMCSGVFSSSIRANREGKPPLPQMYDSNFVEQLKPFIPHLKQAKFLGGEPFLIDIYYDIWELFIKSNPSCEIIITTNGTVFTNKVQRVLENLNCQIIVSLDSVTKDTYEGIRVNAVMERTLDHLDKFMSLNRDGLVCELARHEYVFQYGDVSGERVAQASAGGGPGPGSRSLQARTTRAGE